MMEDLSSNDSPIHKLAGVRWHVLHVKPRREKKVVEQCRFFGLPHFLALRSETKIYQRRRVTVHKPVFPGYVFAAFDEPGRIKLLRTDNLVRVMVPVDEDRLIHELQQVQIALSVDPSLGATDALRRGRMIRIKGGPFRGVEGIIDRLKNETTVCLNVDLIGQAIRVEVDKDFVDLLD